MLSYLLDEHLMLLLFVLNRLICQWPECLALADVLSHLQHAKTACHAFEGAVLLSEAGTRGRELSLKVATCFARSRIARGMPASDAVVDACDVVAVPSTTYCYSRQISFVE